MTEGNGLLWLGLGGVALYAAYEMGLFGTTAVAASTVASPTAGTTSSPQANNPTSLTTGGSAAPSSNSGVSVPSPSGGSMPAPATIAALQAYVHSWITSDSNFVLMTSGQYAGQWVGSPYHWNFYLNYGAPGTVGDSLNASMFAGTNAASDLTQAITESQFWAAVTPMLQSNYGMSGLGMIAHHANPYLQGPRANSQAFGAGLAPRGVETMITVIGG